MMVHYGEWRRQLSHGQASDFPIFAAVLLQKTFEEAHGSTLVSREDGVVVEMVICFVQIHSVLMFPGWLSLRKDGVILPVEGASEAAEHVHATLMLVPGLVF